MDQYDLQTILGVFLIAAITAAVYPAAIMLLDQYVTMLLATLGFFGIQIVWRGKGYAKLDLFEGILTNMEVIGIAGITSISWLYGMAVMPYAQYMNILMMILAALGITWTHGLVTAYILKIRRERQ